MTAPRTSGAIALAATLAIQVYVSFAANATAVLAPIVAPEFALSPKLVGVFIGLVYAGSMFASLAAGGWIARHGPIRISQTGVVTCAIGLALLPLATLVPIVALPLLIVAPLVIGAGYGPITPSSSQILARTARPERMALTFSLKQTGVPAGAALGGVILPALALTLGWQLAFVATSLIGVVVALAAQPLRSDLDSERDRTRRPPGLRALFAPLRGIVRHPVLFELSVVSFFYAAIQVSLTSFLVVYLTEALGRSLVAAGLSLTVATLGGVVGRVLWGIVADAWRPRAVLGTLGLVAGVVSLALAAYPADGPATLLLVLCALFGATAIGWNGVQLAELARHAPRGEAAAVTGASVFITFAGVVVGPPLFALLASVSGSYRIGFVAMGAATLLCGAWLLARTARR